MQPTASARQCVRGHPLIGDGLFCQACGAFQLDPEGTVAVGGRGERILAWFLNLIISLLTLFIGWVIWWFIVAPRGQNPGKAIVGLRVIRTDGQAVRTGGMFVRGLAGLLCGLIPLYLDYLWILWDKDVQTIHDKVVSTVVVKANGSEKIVEQGHLAGALTPPSSYAPYAPPVSIPQSSPSTATSQVRGADEVYCRNCGRAVKADAQFCPNCGASLAG